LSVLSLGDPSLVGKNTVRIHGSSSTSGNLDFGFLFDGQTTATDYP
jgi:hypothetical protein